jgi:predicted dehydrogenase
MIASLVISGISCRKKQPVEKQPEKKYPVTLMTLDPGHFHAGLVQKTMYEQVSPTVYVYAPTGPDVNEHLKRIEGFNKRPENPTRWVEKVYIGNDFFEKMLADKPGNPPSGEVSPRPVGADVVVLSGNNRKKAEYIKRCVDAGLNVLADKPMCIDTPGFDLLEDAFEQARRSKVIIYDIMTERSEITTILQKELAEDKELFGKIIPGSAEQPAIEIESVHHFFKTVSGNPLKRPGWYFDTNQQGEGIVDVTTHLIDLVMWECFPEQPIDYHTDIEVVKANRRPTMISREQFTKSTGLEDFPDFLKDRVNEKGELACFANGEIVFKIKGLYAKVSVVWNFEAPPGGQDTHYAIIRGSLSNAVIRQGKEQNYRPELYIEPAAGVKPDELKLAVEKSIDKLTQDYAGLNVEEQNDCWRVIIPDKYRVGHEAHFGLVSERFLKYMTDGNLPEWEIANMRAKYYTTTKALEMAQPGVEFIQGKDAIDVLIGGNLFTTYRYGLELTKPILYPVKSPSGVVLTRRFPFEIIPGESNDHPHHFGIFFTYDKVNNDGFWNNKTSPPQIKHVKFTKMSDGQLSTVSQWDGNSGKTLLEEKRDMVFSAEPNQYTIDFNITLTAQDEKIVFSDTKEGMFAIRVADWLSEEKGTGRYFDSNGNTGEPNVWGKRGPWARLEGNKDGKTIGIAIFNHPDSVNYPTYWHARGYGLFSANPLGQLDYQKGTKAENPQPLNFTLNPGQSALFRFRMIVYEGPRSPEQFERQFEDFARR